MRLSINSLGMISSLGFGAIASCAAIRAGLSRPRECPSFTVLDPTVHELVPVVGRPIRGYTEGFSQTGLWLRLARGCVLDLLQQEGIPNASDTGFWRRTGLMVVLPSFESERFPNEKSASPEALYDALLQRLLTVLRLPLQRVHAEILALGHAGVITAVQQARRRMAATGLERLLVLAVDSYLDGPTLQWLAAARRLKAGDVPYGLIPGEAGACFMLETEASLRQRQLPPRVFVESTALGIEERHRFQQEPNNGMGLARVLQEALETASPGKPFQGDIICDLNGENWRARELGNAWVRARGQLGEDVRIIAPAESLGETGAASGAVGVCVAVRSLSRRYSRTGQVVLLSSAEPGQVGAMVLGRADKA
ncbi:hypothetical protein [Archangium lansingense]|uniref:3-oxoacyl-[acyl-carrier-protein] synthase-1 n=1 Tax=Archangium lansingense TaxID=2995310 RepID=A0ABT4ANE1_9BACT|nr:hypothetical protein [Archangium lansinium]MCY1083210.1 hypothetical protein [Archangium lansinium]